MSGAARGEVNQLPREPENAPSNPGAARVLTRARIPARLRLAGSPQADR